MQGESRLKSAAYGSVQKKIITLARGSKLKTIRSREDKELENALRLDRAQVSAKGGRTGPYHRGRDKGGYAGYQVIATCDQTVPEKVK